MSKGAKKKPQSLRKEAEEKAVDRWRILGPVVLIGMTLACYWAPMTSPQTSILWDAADYYQVVQNYFSQELHAGRLPFWSPYPWAGYPFLADPQVGAWYPLNWPFFAIGVSPRMLVVEHWLHALLGCFGAYFLALRLLRNRPAAVLVGLCYGLSGFFVGHSSHTTMLQCAAWMPWLLLLLDRAVSSHALRNTLIAGLIAGMMILAGHFQTILYSFLALGLFAVAQVATEPARWRRVFGMALAIPLMGALISAIATGPGLELALHSVRASLAAVTRTEGFIPLPALITAIYPNFYGVLSETYTGPADITQFYFYAGILLVPLAVAGVRDRRLRWTGLLLIVPTIWYAMGSSAGLYLLIARLPGFSSVRAPVNIWFVASLGLAILAGAGMVWVGQRVKGSWVPAAIVVLFCIDLFYFQSAINPLAYSRTSYQELYGSNENLFRRAVASNLPPLTRFDAPEHLPSLGPMSDFLTERTEVTYGYGPMPLQRYSDYVSAMQSNPKLRNGFNVSRWLDTQAGAVRANPDVMPRVNFAKRLVPTHSMAESEQRLSTLDQRTEALVPADLHVADQDGDGTAEVKEFLPGHYRIHYKCRSASLLRIGNAYFDGWRAQVDGHNLPVEAVDHALMGVVVPAGERDLSLDYHSTYFPVSAAVTAISLCAWGACLWWERRKTAVGPREAVVIS